MEIHRVDSMCTEADDYVFMWIRMQQIRVTWLQFNSGLIYDLGKFLRCEVGLQFSIFSGKNLHLPRFFRDILSLRSVMSEQVIF